MHGQDRRMRRVGLPGNVCCAVIKLGEGFDVERLRRRIVESPIMDWLARARIQPGASFDTIAGPLDGMFNFTAPAARDGELLLDPQTGLEIASAR